MGTASATKVLKVTTAGVMSEETTLITSAGAGDADKVVALGATGVLHSSIINAVTTSAGAGSSAKIVALDAAGKIDTTMMPVGVAADTATLTASEALAAGDLVNTWNNAAVASVRKADASVAGKEAHGFVLAAFASSAAATVYFEGSNTQCTGLTPGLQFLSSSTAGKSTTTAPTTAGQVVQTVGFAYSATALNFQSGTPVTRA